MEKPDYQTLNHTGDLGWIIEARDFAELLHKASWALTDTLIDASTVRPLLEVHWEVSAPTLEGRLVAHLQEILYQFDAHGMVFGEYELECAGERVTCRARGEKLDRERHCFKTEIKAVTYHQLKVVRGADGRWSAQVILDV